MNHQLQQNLPAHLKQYVGSDRPAYIPPHIEKQLNQQMQKTMPAHLKQYAGAYMEQRVIQPNTTAAHTQTLASRPPTPDPRRLDHAIPVGEQHNALWADPSNPTTVPNPASLSFQGQQTQNDEQAPNGQYDFPPAAPHDPSANHNPYEFIINPTTPKRRGRGLFNGGSPLKGVAILAGAAVVLLIVAAIVISALAPKGSTPELISATEQQQEIIRIATNATKTATGQDTQNFVNNVQASITSDQVQLLTYLASHGTKVSNKTLALDQDAQTDTLLTAASTAGTYDTTVTRTLDADLQAYAKTLKTAYQESHATEAKKLLNSSYTHAMALTKQADKLSSETSN